jgi:hypothetical protein
MSARACSSARSVFFARQVEPLEELAHQRPTDRLARARGEPPDVLGQRGVAVLPDQRPDDVVARGGDLRRRAAGVRLGRPAPVLTRLLAPEIHGRQTDPELGRDLCTGRAPASPASSARSRRSAE